MPAWPRRNGFDTGDTMYRPWGVYARLGERITCVRGHVIAVFARDCYKGEVINADMFMQRQNGLDWRPGARLYSCAICGQPWTNKGMMHFEDGWRS